MTFRLLDRKLHPNSTLPIWFWGFRNSPESLVRIHYRRIPGFLKLGKKKPKLGPKFHLCKWLSKFACVHGLRFQDSNEIKLLLHEKDSSKLRSWLDESFRPNRIPLLSTRFCKLHQNNHDEYHPNVTCADKMLVVFLWEQRYPFEPVVAPRSDAIIT